MKKKIRPFFLIIFCLVIAGLILGCGGGGGGDGSTQAPIPVNPSGYPDVAGVYSFMTSTATTTCTDGSTAPFDAFAKNFTITQNINQLLMKSSPTSFPSTTTVKSNTNLNGNVDLSGNFISNQTIVLTLANILGNFTYNYNMTGTFTATGWSGTYKYTGFNDFYKVSCTATTNFAGELISKSAAIKSPSEQAEADGTPVKVESVYDLATRLLGLSVDGSGPPDNP